MRSCRVSPRLLLRVAQERGDHHGGEEQGQGQDEGQGESTVVAAQVRIIYEITIILSV